MYRRAGRGRGHALAITRLAKVRPPLRLLPAVFLCRNYLRVHTTQRGEPRCLNVWTDTCSLCAVIRGTAATKLARGKRCFSSFHADCGFLAAPQIVLAFASS